MIESIFRHIDRVYGLELEVDIQDFLISSDMCVGLGQGDQSFRCMAVCVFAVL